MRIEVYGKFLRLHGGTLRLNDDQAKRRLHNLKKRDDDRYDIVNPVEFKIGEVFEYEGTGLPKGYMGRSDPTLAAPVTGSKPAAGGASSTGDSAGKAKGKPKGKAKAKA